MIILFPQHPLDKSKVEPDFEQEYQAAKLQGFETLFFDYDRFVSNGILRIPSGTGEIIYRGWMLQPHQYNHFYDIISDYGYNLINNPVQYKNCHYFTEVYSIIKEYTVKSNWVSLSDFRKMSLSEVESFLNSLTHPVIIKDYVKSEKGSDLFKIDTRDPIEFIDIVEKFVKARRSLFNEGIVLKEFIELKKYHGYTNEWRIFVYKGQIITTTFNVNVKNLTVSCPNNLTFISDIISEIDSNFFTIDIAEKEDGSWFILETGDGQVSGLASFLNPLQFYSLLQ